MSSRALRKLEKKNKIDELSLLEEKLNASKDAVDGVGVDSEIARPKAPVNMFAMFGDDEEESEEEDEESEDEEKEVHAAPVATTPVSNKCKKSKSGKVLRKSNDDDDDDFDTLVDNFQKQNLQEYYSSMDHGSADENSEFNTQVYDLKDDPGFTKYKNNRDTQALFSSIKTSFLDPQTELKSLFDDIPSSLLNETASDSSGMSQHQQQQMKRLKRMIRNWATGKNKKIVPNGPSLTRTLMFTNVRDDWLPTQSGELHMKLLNDQDVLDWLAYLRPDDWLDVIKEDFKAHQKIQPKVKYYKFEPLSREQTSKNMVEFYMSVVLHPDHEALISLVQSQAPYFVPGLLQVATVLVRQGDRTNSNGLVERALFVFDRALKNGLTFNGVDVQLPYIYFFNRQFYLGVFQYIGILEQRGCIGSASNWCKVLWSLSPCEDPLGCRYFIDHYLLQDFDYKFLIQLSENRLFTQYHEWQTFNLDMSIVLSFLKMDLHEQAASHMKLATQRHPYAVREFFIKGLNGDSKAVPAYLKTVKDTDNVSEDIQLSFYLLRMGKYWQDKDLAKLNHIMCELWTQDLEIETRPEPELIQNERLYLEGLPINLLRFTLLSQESSIMHKLPTSIFEKYQVFDYDILPPPYDEELEKIDKLPLETVHDFMNQKDLVEKSTHLVQDQDLLDMIQRMSMQEYVAENEQP